MQISAKENPVGPVICLRPLGRNYVSGFESLEGIATADCTPLIMPNTSSMQVRGFALHKDLHPHLAPVPCIFVGRKTRGVAATLMPPYPPMMTPGVCCEEVMDRRR